MMIRLLRRTALWTAAAWFVVSVSGAAYGWYSGMLRDVDGSALESLTTRTGKVESAFRKMLASDLVSQVGVNPRKRAEEQLFLMGGTTKGDEEWRRIAPLAFGVDAVKGMLAASSRPVSMDQTAGVPAPAPVLFPVVDIAGGMCLDKGQGVRECAVTLTVAGKSAFWVWRRQGEGNWKFLGRSPEGFDVTRPKLTGKDVGFDLVSLTDPQQSRSFAYDPSAGRTNSSAPFRQNEGAAPGQGVSSPAPGQGISSPAAEPPGPGADATPAGSAMKSDIKIRYDDGGDFDDGDSTTSGGYLSSSGKRRK